MQDTYLVGERDVFIVLRAHGLADEMDDMLVMDLLDVVRREPDRIEDAAAYGSDEEERTEFALCEVEAILVEGGHIHGQRRFEMLEEVGA
jgi:hypothetical protein